MRADHFLLAEHDWVPNNPRLPVIVYRRAVTASEDMAATFETLFGSNGWPAQWRDSVYDIIIIIRPRMRRSAFSQGALAS